MQLNLFNDLMKTEQACHGGINSIDVYRVFDSQKHRKQLDFVDFVRVPSGSSIGLHQHGNNREWYVILQGQGKMTFCGDNIAITCGDVLINPAFGQHALFNQSDQDIVLAVLQFSGACQDEY